MADDTHSRFAAVSADNIYNFKLVVGHTTKTYEARSFVRHWNMMCDIFNLGFIIFQCPLATVHQLCTEKLVPIANMSVAL